MTAPPLLKTCALALDGTETPVRYGDVWRRERTPGGERLVIGADAAHVEVIEALSHRWIASHKILYVLVVPRGEAEWGRYESPWISRDRAVEFLRRFERFLAHDARHNVWFAAPEEGVSLVWDRHDRIYAYGPLDAYEALLAVRGFRRGEPAIASPHSHYYHAENDDDARALHAWWPWLRYDLQPDDE